jgi:hypothetical protein
MLLPFVSAVDSGRPTEVARTEVRGGRSTATMGGVRCRACPCTAEGTHHEEAQLLRSATIKERILTALTSIFKDGHFYLHIRTHHMNHNTAVGRIPSASCTFYLWGGGGAFPPPRVIGARLFSCGFIARSVHMPVAAKRGREDPSAVPARKKSAKGITISGGKPQPPRVIGYKRTNANVDISIRVEKRCFPAHSNVLAESCGFFKVRMPAASVPHVHG